MEETGEREMEMRDGTGGTGKSRREKGQEISITALPITPSSMGLCLQGNGEILEKLRDGESQDKSKSEKRKGNISSAFLLTSTLQAPRPSSFWSFCSYFSGFRFR